MTRTEAPDQARDHATDRAWHHALTVGFGDCDPAGIVFYPRYYEMLNRVVEGFFANALHHDFARIHLVDRCGVPTARLDTVFRAPSRLGDVLDFALTVDRLGRSSATLDIAVTCGGQLRMTARQVLVWTGPDLKPRPWPADLAAAMATYRNQEEAAT